MDRHIVVYNVDVNSYTVTLYKGTIISTFCTTLIICNVWLYSAMVEFFSSILKLFLHNVYWRWVFIPLTYSNIGLKLTVGNKIAGLKYQRCLYISENWWYKFSVGCHSISSMFTFPWIIGSEYSNKFSFYLTQRICHPYFPSPTLVCLFSFIQHLVGKGLSGFLLLFAFFNFTCCAL